MGKEATRRSSAQPRQINSDGFARMSGDFLQQPQSLKLAIGVGRERDGRADLSQLGRLLIHIRGEAAPPQRQRQREPADAPADDADA